MPPSGIFVAAFSSFWTFILANTATSTSNIISYPLVPHHAQRMRRRHLMTREYDTGSRPTSVDSASGRRRASAQQVGALYQGYGTHYVDLWCGSPPQRQTVVVDTGSSLTAFPCSGCDDCGVPKHHIDALFDEHDSTTFQQKTCAKGCFHSRSRCTGDHCSIYMKYAEETQWHAFESVDSCYIGGPHEVAVQDDGATDDLDPRHVHVFDLVFGCQTHVTGSFKTQLADGIMGMNARSESFWSQMFVAGKLGSERQFSLCFSRSPIVERKGIEAGAVTLGGVDERFDKSPMVYTPDSNGGREGFFSVRVRRVYLREGSAGESAKSSHPSPNQGIRVLDVPEDTLNTGGITVDSGTTDTYWNRGIADAFNQAFFEMTGRHHSNNDELSLTHAELMALPTVLFQLVSSPEVNAGMDAYETAGLAGSLDDTHPFDVVLAFPPSHYMEYDDETGMYTSRFYLTNRSTGSILGANAMMGHNVLFDSDNHRIGWAESDCDYTKLVTDSGYDFSISGNLQSPPPPTTPVATQTLHPTGAPQMAATSEPQIIAVPEPSIRPTSVVPTDPPVAHSTEPPTDRTIEPPDPTQSHVVPVTDPPVAFSTLPSTDTPVELSSPRQIPASPPTDLPVESPTLRPTDPPFESPAPIEAPDASPTYRPVVLASGISTESSVIVPTTITMRNDEMKETTLKVVEGCTTIPCQVPVFAGLIILMYMSCFLCCCVCLRLYFSWRICCPRSDYAYSSAVINERELKKFRDDATVAGFEDDVGYEDDHEDEYSGKYGGNFDRLTVSNKTRGETLRGPWGNLQRRYCAKVGVPKDDSLPVSAIEKSSVSFASPLLFWFPWFPTKVARQKA